jgi:site-specific DNA recombinase
VVAARRHDLGPPRAVRRAFLARAAVEDQPEPHRRGRGRGAGRGEFYSRNLANEVNKGLIQKAKNGGTPFRAPLGYRPVRVFTEDGREVRSVEIDPERGPLVQQAFEMYSTGEWTVRTLLDELTPKGLGSRPTPKRPSRPISISAFHELLRNPYYIGIVDYRGVRYDGKHPPLISQRIFDEVQRILEVQNYAGEKKRKHHHYLKGSVWCGCCGSRLIVTNARSRSGQIYPYFTCIGRQRNPNSCTQRAVLIDHVEELVAEYYTRFQLGHDLRLETEQTILEQMAALRENEVLERDRLVRRQRKLLAERGKLLEAHYAGAIPLELLKAEQERISNQLQRIEERLSSTDIKYLEAEKTLKRALELSETLAQAYREASPSLRRLMNQALFERLIIDADESATGTLNDPFALLMEAAGRTDVAASARANGTGRRPQKRQEARKSGPHGLSKTKLVELAGLEPATSWVRSRIWGIQVDPRSPRITAFCRNFDSKLCPSDNGFPPLVVHGRVAYGLQGLLPRLATPSCRVAGCGLRPRADPSLRGLISCRHHYEGLISLSSEDAPSPGKPHGSEGLTPRRWRPKTQNDRGVDPA